MADVIRSDVVQIGFDIDNSPLSSLLTDITNLRNQLLGLTGTNPLDSLVRDIRQLNSATDLTTENLQDFRRRVDELGNVDGADELRQEIDRISSQSEITEDDIQSLRRMADRLGNTDAEDLEDDLDDAGDAADGARRDTERLTNELHDTGSAGSKAADALKGGFTIVKGVVADLISNGIQMLIGSLRDVAKSTFTIGADFDSAMSEVSAIGGATGDDLEMLRDTAKEFGSTTVFSASESAQALKFMALAGWDAEKSSSALGGVLDLAASSGMELAQASDMVTDYMSAFGMEASKSGYFADMLAYSQSHANTSVEQLGEAFKNSAANMNAAGQDVETTTSLLAMMANQGFKGSEAGTALTAIMRDMTAKMKDGAIKIGDTSVAVQDASGNYRDLTDILKDVESATDGMGDAERATALSTAFTADSIKGLNLLLNAGVGEAEEFEKQLRNSGGTAKEMADIMNDNLNGDITALKSQFEGIQIAIYEKFEPALRSAVSIISKLLEGASESVNGLVAPITNIIGLIDEFVNLDVKSADDFLNLIDNIASELQPLLLGAANAISTFLPIFLQVGVQIITRLIEGIASAAPILIQGAATSVITLANALITNMPAILSAAVSLIQGLVQGLVTNVPYILQAAILLIMSLATGLIEQLPTIVFSAMQLVVGLVQGIMANLGLLISSAAALVTQLIMGIAECLPMIIQGGADVLISITQGILSNLDTILLAAVQIVLALIVGIVKMIPKLVEAVTNLMFAITGTIANSILGFFGLGEEAGSEFTEGLTDGIEIGTYNAETAAQGVAIGVENGMQLDLTGLQTMGAAAPTSVAAGINSTAYQATSTANLVASQTTAGMELDTLSIQGFGSQATSTLAGSLTANAGVPYTSALNLANQTTAGLELPQATVSGIGANAANNLATGISSNAGTAVSAASSLSSQVESAGYATMQVDVSTDIATSGLADFQSVTESTTSGADQSISELATSASKDFSDMSSAATKQVEKMQSAFKSGMSAIKSVVTSTTNSIKTTFNNLNLYQTGKNIMDGLNRGLNDGKTNVLNTARNIANSVKTTIDNALDINSPSRELFKSGLFTAQGFDLGMQKMIPTVASTAENMATITVDNARSGNSYTPASSTVTNAVSTRNETNNYSPTFNLTVNGNADSRSLERQVKQWFKESLDETFASIGRRNPKVQEV